MHIGMFCVTSFRISKCLPCDDCEAFLEQVGKFISVSHYEMVADARCASEREASFRMFLRNQKALECILRHQKGER